MTKVLVIGGGIGGLTVAAALRRRGIEADVYEAAPELQPVGKGLWVPVNAMQVLDRLGLSQAVEQAGWPLVRVQVRNTGGRVLTDVDLAPLRARYGFSIVSIHRAALVDALAAAIGPDTLHLGKRCAGVEQDASGVTARFEDGTTARGDVLVAADGIKSTVRAQVFPPVRFRYGGHTCYRGIGALELPADICRVCWEVWGGAARFGFSPVGPGRVYWFAPVTAPADAPLPTGPALADYLADTFAGFPPPVGDVLRHTPAGEIIRTDIYDFAPIDRWWDGRVVLLGDAAHATTPNLGQGGAQAVEDAYVLAEQLAACATPAEAFAAYQRVRMPKARWVVDRSWRFGRLAHVRHPLLRGLRDVILSWAPRRIADRQIANLANLNY
jgi:2-polyprenyl-6-methoxyphenol hydroxylase-like FAD-dependent oxidoreductase